MHFKQTTVGARLAWGFGLVILAGLVVALYGRYQLQRIGSEMRTMIDDRMIKVVQVNEVIDNVNLVARAVRNIALLAEEQEMQRERQRISAAWSKNSALFGELQQSIRSERGRALLAQAQAARGPYNAAIEQAIRLGLANDNQRARDLLLREARPLQTAYFKTLYELLDYQKAGMQKNADAAQQIVLHASTVMLGITMLAACLSTVFAWWLWRGLMRQLGGEPAYAAQVVAQIAAGNLRVPIALRRGDSVSLLAAMGRMRDQLGQVVSTVREGAERLAAASAEIAQGNQDLAGRTEQQASALEQTAASMEQLAATVRQNADGARQANQLAQSASAVAADGGAVVGQVVRTMGQIQQSSQQIGDIIGVIDRIAFQTNILALNAAVEAARAGEQGRGFAVVATEVRALAGRSAEAAHQIKALIGASLERVDEGSALVQQAGSTMTHLVASIGQVTTIMGEISDASREQAAGVAQVGQAVSQMDQATQHNATLVEEMATAAVSLHAQAGELVQVVSVFQVGTPARRLVA
ncbi:MAG: methyl-accepting chemotaxis protein [Sphingomonadaceae bacterium]